MFLSNLLAAGMGGLEHFNATNIIEDYLTSYNCTGGANSENWESVTKIVTSQYCYKPINENKTIRSLVGKRLSEVSLSMPITSDQ